jgi:hypothetical protein
MKRLTPLLGAAVVAGALAAPSLAGAPGQAVDPYPAKQVEVGLYVDTVTSSRTTPRPSRVCTQTNFFPQGSRVVFRMWAVDTATGKSLTNADVKYAYIKIPGQPNAPLNWSAHGTAPNQVQFWSYPWPIPTTYPLGLVNYKIVLKTNDDRFGTYTPPPIDSAQLTVTPK